MASIAARCAVALGPTLASRGPTSARRLATAAEVSPWNQFWKWTTQPRPSWRESKTEAAVVFCVFGITGSTSVAVVRPILRETTGIEGTMRDGPWSYRVFSFLAVSPVYACVLVTVGTAAGRHTYFRGMALRIFGRFIPAALKSRLAPAVVTPPHLVPNAALIAARYRAPPPGA